VSLFAAGCQVFGSGSSPAALTRTSITVAALPGVTDAPLYLALHDGMFANAGLTVNIQTYSSVGKEIAALTNGSPTSLSVTMRTSSTRRTPLITRASPSWRMPTTRRPA
jgi:ABC-type nitrate/sulfonate/bicarbonate transport system substrate-binding protein